MSIRQGIVALFAVLVLAFVAYGNYQRTEQVNTDIHNLRASLCGQERAQVKGSQAFHALLEDLAARAAARERIDIASGNTTQAQADADSFKLYTDVAAGMEHPQSSPFCS